MPRKKNNYDEPKPFSILKEFAKKYPKVWDICDDIHDHNGRKGLPSWNTLCEIPIGATLAVMQEYPKDTDRTYMIPAECAALYAWRKHKEIYSFDEDLSKLLMSQASDVEIPLDVLYTLPYPCVWIQAAKRTGFFVWFEDDVHTHMMELRLLVFTDDEDPENLMLHLKPGWTISDGINDTIATIKAAKLDPELLRQGKEAGETLGDYDYDRLYEYQYSKISQLIQLVLYICADNMEAQENEQHKAVMRRTPSGQKPKDTFREIQKWDVGYRIGNTIRKYNSQQQVSVNANGADNPSGTGSPKRPHSRRGHYHHYWVGSEKDGTRRIILKWVAPMFINGDEDNVIPTQHKVK